VLAVSPSSPNVVYAGSLEKGVFRSDDKGASLNFKAGPFVSFRVFALHPANSDVFYTAGFLSANKTTDGGNSWRGILTGLFDPFHPSIFMIGGLAIAPGNPNVLYASSEKGIFKTRNSGSLWSNVTSNLTKIQALTVDPADANKVYAGDLDGILKSTDGGAHWSRSSMEIDIVNEIIIAPDNPNTLYVVSDESIYKSTDGGISWNRLNLPIDLLTDTSSLAIDPINPNIMYVGTSKGVLRTTNGGESWSEINSGLSNLRVQVLALDPSDHTALYAGTNSGGVFSIQLRIAPKITGAAIQGKNLAVTGDNFGSGSVILVDGQEQKTKFDIDAPGTLIGKKTGKKLPRGQPVTLQVRNADGSLSNELSFTR
jgi:hypothetical protein